MANAKQLKSGTWRIVVAKSINGQKVQKSFTLSPADCGGDSKLAKRKVELMAKEWQLSAEAEANKITLLQIFEKHLRMGKDVWSPSTYKDYLNMPKHFESILDMDVNDIKTENIQILVNQWTVNGLSDKTIRNRVNFFKASFESSDLERVFKVKIKKTIHPTLLPPEQSEFHRLLANTKTNEEKLMLVFAGLYTMRRGEMGGLCGEDILRDMNNIYIHTSKVKNEKKEWIRKEMPKNSGSIRVVHVDPEIMALIPKVAPKEYIFQMTPDAMTRRFERLCDKSCINHCRLHDLRKYAASIRSEMMPSKYIEADGGWSKESRVMQTVYDKPFKEKRKEYSKRFNDMVIQDYGHELFGN